MKTIPVCLSVFLYATAAGHAGGMHNTPSGYRNGETVTSEPGPYMMQLGQTLYVDDGSCPAGRIKQVVAPMSRGQPRTRQCVVH